MAQTLARKSKTFDSFSSTQKSALLSKVKTCIDGMRDSEFEINKHNKRINGTTGFINQLWQILRTNVRITTLPQVDMIHEYICTTYGWTIKQQGKGKATEGTSSSKEVSQFFSNIRRAYKRESEKGLVPDCRFKMTTMKNVEKDKFVNVADYPQFDLFKECLTYQDMIKALNESVINSRSVEFTAIQNDSKLINTHARKLEREGNEKALLALQKDYENLKRKHNIVNPAPKKSKSKS